MNARRTERVLRVVVLHLALGALLTAASAAPCAAQDAPARSGARAPFSADERARLAKGELVTRPAEERRGTLRLIGGQSWQVIDAPPAGVWRAMMETKYYARMLPAVSSASLVSKDAALRRVKIAHKMGPLGVSYRLAFKPDPARRDMTFKLNDPLDSGMRAAWGFITAHPYGNKTLIAYGVMADPGEGLLVGLARRVMHTWLLRVPWTMKRFLEGETGRSLYGHRAQRACEKDGNDPHTCAPPAR